MIPYNKALDPPAPFLDITISTRSNRRWRATIPSLLDTGSEITAIPERTIERLRLYPVGRLKLTGIHSTKITTPIASICKFLRTSLPTLRLSPPRWSLL